jgi:CBS domain containing-hemolysin-like protein
VSVPLGTTPEQLEDAVARTGFSRFPVESEGKWVGYVHLADALAVTSGRSRPLPKARIRALPKLSAELPLPVALSQLRSSGAHLAQVKDGQDSVGLVMLEDVLEMLVGEVQDVTSSRR